MSKNIGLFSLAGEEGFEPSAYGFGDSAVPHLKLNT